MDDSNNNPSVISKSTSASTKSDSASVNSKSQSTSDVHEVNGVISEEASLKTPEDKKIKFFVDANESVASSGFGSPGDVFVIPEEERKNSINGSVPLENPSGSLKSVLFCPFFFLFV